MSFSTLFETILLGLVEGFTEFLPVSSTGPLILVRELLGFNPDDPRDPFPKRKRK